MALLTEKDRMYKTPEDICAHLGDEYEKFMGAIVPPIFQNSLFVQPTDVNGVEASGYTYTRAANPTIEIAEKKIAALEGADGALCFATGMAAISNAILYYTRADCHIVIVESSYGNSRTLISQYLPKRYNTTCTFVDGGSIEEIRNAVTDKTSLIFVESPSSHVFRMQDLEEIAKIAKSVGAGTVIDNTYATPLHQNPLKYGIDIVCHTISKYMGGHSDILGGAIAARREIIEEISANERLLLGGTMDPHQAWLLIRGLRTFPLRVKQHGENAKKVAAFLEKHKNVEKVFYPGSESYPQKELFEKYLTGTNGLMSITPKGTKEQAMKFSKNLHHFQYGCSWGGFESLAIFLGDHYGEKNLVRLHVGLEDPDALIADLDQALNAFCGE